MEIRAEISTDVQGVYGVNVAAFGRENEAKLVDRLRELPATLSFVAVDAEQIVGYICFSPVTIVGDCSPEISILGLAPMAVLPRYQRQGIGSALIQFSLAVCRRSSYQAVVVLGHPDYYPKFGFVPAKTKGLGCEYPVPDEVFMVLELQVDALVGCEGRVMYRPEFAECE